MKWQILIPTMPKRADFLRRLMDRLEPQLVPGVSIVTDAGEESIGKKRTRMIANATADYISFVDDDDLVAADYVPRILRALEGSPDVVGMVVHVTMDGRPWQPSPLFEHSLRYRHNHQWAGRLRPPHHLCAMRRSIAASVPFPDMNWGEDVSWARKIEPHLHQEAWPGDDPLYFYDYITNK